MPEVGISRYSRSLVREMLARSPEGLELALADLEGSAWEPERVWTVGRGHGLGRRLWQEQVRLRRMSGRADLLHLPWYEGPVAPRSPLVVTVYDLDTIERPFGYSWRFRAYYNALLRQYVRRAARIIVLSKASLEALERRWPGRPYVYIPAGVDPVFSTGSSAAPAREQVILYTGGFGDRKGLPDLLDAFDLVFEKDPGAKLVLTGAASDGFREEAGGRRSAQRIEFTGRVSDTRLADLYRMAAVVAYPSHLEGFGFPIVEAFACGTPVVTTATGAPSEVAGGAALLVEPGRPTELADALSAVLSDASLAGTLREKGLARVRDFSWSRAADATLAVYRELL
jgi:glycosyltransferase involved in cell wall biosynthesis